MRVRSQCVWEVNACEESTRGGGGQYGVVIFHGCALGSYYPCGMLRCLVQSPVRWISRDLRTVWVEHVIANVVRQKTVILEPYSIEKGLE